MGSTLLLLLLAWAASANGAARDARSKAAKAKSPTTDVPTVLTFEWLGLGNSKKGKGKGKQGRATSHIWTLGDYTPDHFGEVRLVFLHRESLLTVPRCHCAMRAVLCTLFPPVLFPDGRC